MTLAIILGISVALSAAAGVEGYKLLQSPPPAQSPTQEPPQTPSKPEDVKPEENAPAAAEPPAPTPQQTAPPPSAPAQPPAETTPPAPAKPPATTTKKHRKSSKPAKPVPNAGPSRVVVKEGSTPDPSLKLSHSLTEEQIAKQRQTVTQLITSAEANLSKLAGRTLNASQQDMVKQTQAYLSQAKSAMEAGDVQRSQNLATKAQLLSEDLLKH